ncbi:L-threonine 3-dehydrogenase [Candidatus Woesebacteria bacterium RIFCSPLOWO2_01_FULL_39_23]|uniref:L-threonine 3-dehydrogenase n=1 Tax=Candidatus Woesebacteria bacterium RIFCSPHIGHO2_01_FULL_40_22 TaxID=1802499 RepID=A0A1F7YI00_9BACT|nr:MAG: L-threonine 3-dehydrogenase [Candidatus Woesebacteria bacterium RBG_16_40_11]OGM26509.1 MAG: L-threonine 3-dehydrogenase [Candidatus Woesebacteria bacterium RIFCSPHIGHO2_01_FULL_40_22]OGM37676.1 MAG: L-threonine 3-dehydrogenase [Candidatus Woesebacteria bacterium RIFCSPHIGHO2_12_FULL_38_9]OGM62962.1 MAG: L-threonine 3-dehydrogenase [Candidatus Woesebacteria bacterium RIFCSPLOWO2_01_FULL_39_23]
MKALVKTAKTTGLKLVDVATPKVGSSDVLIKVKATSICGTDLHIYNWDNWAKLRVKNLPLIQGHELCGEIVKTGKNVKQLKTGDFISAESHIVDYNGEFYKNNLGHVAPETKIIGVDTNGSFAEYIALPWQNARRNPKDLHVNIAVLKENFGNAVHAAFKIPLTGKTVLIAGCGPVGLMSLLAAKEQKAKLIIASDISGNRINFAKKLGANFTVNPKNTNLPLFISEKTNGVGVDVLLEMSGAESAMLDGIKSVRAGGDVIAFGLYPKPINFDINSFVIFKGITIHGVVGRLLWTTWEQLENLVDNSKVDLSPIVTHTFKLEEFEKAFEVMESGNSGKVVMIP